jgi:hypothetical protein
MSKRRRRERKTGVGEEKGREQILGKETTERKQGATDPPAWF